MVVRVAERGIVAADTSALQRFYAGIEERETAVVREAMATHRLVLPPPVLSEVLIDPELTLDKAARVRAIPLLKIKDGYWDRAGILRGTIRSERYKAHLADCLIAQCCIDHGVPIVVCDADFRHFVRAGLTFA